MNINCIVLCVNPYSFNDEKTNELREGVSVKYLLTDNLSPTEEMDGSRGYKVAKSSFGMEVMKAIKEVPAVYSVEFSNKLDSQGRITQKAISLQYAQPLDSKPVK